MKGYIVEGEDDAVLGAIDLVPECFGLTVRELPDISDEELGRIAADICDRDMHKSRMRPTWNDIGAAVRKALLGGEKQ